VLLFDYREFPESLIRAAERYADVSEDDLRRQRERGWGAAVGLFSQSRLHDDPLSLKSG